MAEFNITNSTVEQLNDTGDNVKIAGNTAPVVVSGSEVVQTVGDGNMVEVTAPKAPSFWSQAWDKAKASWKWFIGLFM